MKAFTTNFIRQAPTPSSKYFLRRSTNPLTPIRSLSTEHETNERYSQFLPTQRVRASDGPILLRDARKKTLWLDNRLKINHQNSPGMPIEHREIYSQLRDMFPELAGDCMVLTMDNRYSIVRLMNDGAKEILRQQQVINVGGVPEPIRPYLFTPKPHEPSPNPNKNGLIVRNFIPGWSSFDYELLIKDAFERLNLQKKYKHVDQFEFSKAFYAFINFESEEDVNKVLERYGHEAVYANEGSGLIFENMELWIGRAAGIGSRNRGPAA